MGSRRSVVRDPLIIDVPDAAFLAAAPFEETSSLAKANIIDGFVGAVRDRTPWGDALVAAMGQWSAPAEVVDAAELIYLIAGEAFDWLCLAERLLRALDEAIPGAVPLDERERVLFHGGLPEGVTPEGFRKGLGPDKYRAHLNYFYGVVVEEALWHAVERETVKERGVRGIQYPVGLLDLVSRKLYRADSDVLIRRFWREQGKRPAAKFSLSQWKEFSYWLFKLRVGWHDSSRTASDTRKGLSMLEELWGALPQTHAGLDFNPHVASGDES